MKKITLILSIMTAGILFQAASVFALDPPAKKIPKSYEIDGLILDKTITPPGHKFHKKFARGWWDRDIELHGNLTIKERPSALKGSLITISFKNKNLFSAIVSPARSEIERKVQTALNQVEQRVQLMLVERLYERNPDIDFSDEF